MSKKHFIALAERLRFAYGQQSTRAQRIAAADMIHAVAQVCAQDNPRFDYDRFYAACGLESATA